MRRSSQQIEADFNRLCDCSEIILDCLYGEDGPLADPDTLEQFVSREEMLGWVAEKQVTYSGILAGVREALNDLTMGVADLLRRRPDVADKVLLEYRDRAGRDFWADAGHPKKMVQTIFERGVIENETEWRLLNGYLHDLDPEFLTKDERAIGEGMIAEFGGP